MDYESLTHLRRNHPAWRLLAADQAPFVIGFLYHGYVRTNTRALSELEAVSRLDDYLHHLREHHGEQAPSRTAREYLANWTDNDRGWLRRYYPPNSDEAHYDLTPPAERANRELHQRKFFVAQLVHLLDHQHAQHLLGRHPARPRLRTAQSPQQVLLDQRRDLRVPAEDPGDLIYDSGPWVIHCGTAQRELLDLTAHPGVLREEWFVFGKTNPTPFTRDSTHPGALAFFVRFPAVQTPVPSFRMGTNSLCSSVREAVLMGPDPPK